MGAEDTGCGGAEVLTGWPRGLNATLSGRGMLGKGYDESWETCWGCIGTEGAGAGW